MLLFLFRWLGALCLLIITVDSTAAQLGVGKSDTDALREPLPEDVILRMGSSRLRHPSGVVSVTFSPDGRLLAGLDEEGIRIWDVSTGQLVRTVTAPRAHVLAFSPDSKTIAVGLPVGGGRGRDQISFRNATTGEEVSQLKG